MVLSGICWGSAGIFLFPLNSIGHQVFIAFVLGGMVAGAVGVFSVTMRDYTAYSLPTLIPITMQFFLQGTDIHIAMGVMVLLFTLIMLATALRMNTTILSSLKLKLEKRDLIAYLTSEKERTGVVQSEVSAQATEQQHGDLSPQQPSPPGTRPVACAVQSAIDDGPGSQPQARSPEHVRGVVVPQVDAGAGDQTSAEPDCRRGTAAD